MRRKIKAGDYWQTGQNLRDSQSGIVTRPLGNLQQRDKEDRKYLMPGVVCGDYCRADQPSHWSHTNHVSALQPNIDNEELQ